MGDAPLCIAYLNAEIVKAMAATVLGSSPRRPETGVGSEDASLMAEEEWQLAREKVEGIGYDAGFRIAEIMGSRAARIADREAAVKFLCKDFWIAAFGKPVDKLQTNNQGVYVIHDNAFRLISAISDAPGRSAAEEAPRYAVIAVGYIRGFLANLGYSSSVDLDTVAPPSCRFRITIH